MSAAKESDKKTVETTPGRYGMVSLANEWLAVLLKSEDSKGLGASELVKKALDDISSGAVSAEEIHKAVAKLKAAPQPEEAEKPKEKKAE